MDRNERKSNIINIILCCLLALFSLLIILFIQITYIKYNIEVENKILLTKQLEQKNKNYSEKIKTNNELKNEIDEFNNIENNIENTKNEVFELIKQLEQKIINNDSDKKIAYLTFDDGPYYATYDFLNVLNQYNIKATFFTIGLGKEGCLENKSENCQKLYKEIVENGHTIANHTYSHSISYGLYSSTNSLINQIKKQEDLIKEKTGKTTNIFRFPGGSGTAKARGVFYSAVEKLKEMKYGWVDWTASNGDGANIGNKIKAFENFKKSINQDIEVVLFHDYSRTTLAMLPEAIEYLQDNGYIILPLFYESVMINK